MALDFPDSPAVGDLYGSPGVVWRWDGEVWSSTSGASGPRGAVAYAEILSNIGGYTGTAVDIYGLYVTWTADPTRTYKTTLYFNCWTAVATDSMIGHITTETGAGTGGATVWAGAANQGRFVLAERVEKGLSGLQTRKGMAQVAGTGPMTISAGPTNPAFILVEDITYEAGSSSQPILKAPRAYTVDFATGPRNDNGPMIDMTAIFPVASVTGMVQFSIGGEIYNGATAMGYALVWDVPNAAVMPYSAHVPQHRISVPETGTVPVNNWYSFSTGVLWTPCTEGVAPTLRCNVFVGVPGQEWYMTARIGVLEIPA